LQFTSLTISSFATHSDNDFRHQNTTGQKTDIVANSRAVEQEALIHNLGFEYSSLSRSRNGEYIIHNDRLALNASGLNLIFNSNIIASALLELIDFALR
jgi:hypothetical protein